MVPSDPNEKEAVNERLSLVSAKIPTEPAPRDFAASLVILPEVNVASPWSLNVVNGELSSARAAVVRLMTTASIPNPIEVCIPTILPSRCQNQITSPGSTCLPDVSCVPRRYPYTRARQDRR